jgi:hypothetical protein
MDLARTPDLSIALVLARDIGQLVDRCNRLEDFNKDEGQG